MDTRQDALGTGRDAVGAASLIGPGGLLSFGKRARRDERNMVLWSKTPIILNLIRVHRESGVFKNMIP